ncbi:hypothetical protein H072_10511 [Dactylellina haptotyla CBS 200.50]|uniref:PNPLA domain-containing protein n=1 Tax=Dactylellina haptotyla (strain CBS 200.50) TaxID=1284197 RepID=S7ZZD3_DACHA|nr:hypothetical protein H072_10511 [Dactylellina haptotyla CBS 200.50]
MDRKDLEAMAYTDPPQYDLTPPHELDILNETISSSNRLSYVQPVSSSPLRLLSLDGGGVKGYSSLLLLQEVMYRLFIEIHSRPPQMHEIPLPCDHFDLIAGVGTGGLIALMLGRLRMDIETCKEQWVKMTKRVFETDKTIAGIPYKATFFKASRLESVIKEITKEHTIGEEDEVKRQQQKKRESNLYPKDMKTRPRAESSGRDSMYSRRSHELRRLAEEPQQPRQLHRERSMMFDVLTKVKAYQDGSGLRKVGNSNTLLYDPREDRCKTFVAAMYQNSPEGTPPCLLRTYLSLTTLNPEPQCKIWEAGRATAATMTAFKPIQVGQTVFLDEGAGRYNICPTVIEEATCNEWPGRAVGCVLSIGTGRSPTKKRNRGQPWLGNKVHTPFDNFTEARKRLVFKTQLSEDTHQALVGEGPDSLDKWGVQKDDYFRLNVDMSACDFAMNEWQRLSDISTSTKRWLCSTEGKKVIGDCALKLAHIWRSKNVPPPKNPLRQIPPMAELPVEPFAPRTPARHYSVIESTPRSNMGKTRPRSQLQSQQFSPATQHVNTSPQISPQPVAIPRSRSIQVPVRTVSQCYQAAPQAYQNAPPRNQPPSAFRDSYYTSEDESDEMRPRPLSVRQKSFTTSSASNSSSSIIVIDGGVVGAGDKVREKRYSGASSNAPPIPKRGVAEIRVVPASSQLPTPPHED